MKALLKKNDVFTFGKSNTLYIVIHTEMTGGGTGHGRHDVYPDLHCVTARKIQLNQELGTEKRFYQDHKKVNLCGRGKVKMTVANLKVK